MSLLSPSNDPPRRGVPNVAVLLTWFVPGAGHLYLGYWKLALVGFVLVEGMFALGLYLSGGMLLEYLPPEMRTRFAPALTPEVGNLGGLLYQLRTFGYGLGHPREWPPLMHLGTTLTAASGAMNLFLMARAHLDARLPERKRERAFGPALVACATWIVPGLGAFLQGRRVRGVVYFVLLCGLFALGTYLAGGSNLDRERHFYYWGGQFLLGAPAILVEFLHGHVPVTDTIPYADAGVVLASVAGMLNVMGMLETFTWSEERMTAKASAAGETVGVSA